MYNQGRIQDLKLGGGREIWSGRSSAEGTRMEEPKAPTGVGSSPGGGYPSPEKFWHVLLRNGAF